MKADFTPSLIVAPFSRLLKIYTSFKLPCIILYKEILLLLSDIKGRPRDRGKSKAGRQTRKIPYALSTQFKARPCRSTVPPSHSTYFTFVMMPMSPIGKVYIHHSFIPGYLIGNPTLKNILKWKNPGYF